MLRAGPKGHHHITEINKNVYRATDDHLADKAITPMEGFTYCEEVKLDVIKIKVG